MFEQQAETGVPFPALDIEAIPRDDRFLADIKEFTYFDMDHTEITCSILEVAMECHKDVDYYARSLRESAHTKINMRLSDSKVVIDATEDTSLTKTWQGKTATIFTHAECQQLFDDVYWYARSFGKLADKPLREVAVRLLIGREWYGRAEWPYKPPRWPW